MTTGTTPYTKTASGTRAASHRVQVLVASGTPDGILAFDLDLVSAELVYKGVAAKIGNVCWITFSPDHKYLYAACEVDSFNAKPTGNVASFSVVNGRLIPLSAQNSASAGTCHVAVDQTGRVLLSADYSGGSAASFLTNAGQLSPAAWTEHYNSPGPNTDRQTSAHAHFASFSPDNRFAYINDLGGNCIHFYRLNSVTAGLTPVGVYQAHRGAGPRTLHFHPNGHTAYSVNELDSTVDVLEWSPADGSLTLLESMQLLPKPYIGPTRASDALISGDGRHVYFANRDNDFVYRFHADTRTGKLTPICRTNCGGRSPRHFVLDPTECWMLVANEDSNLVCVFARNPRTGELAETGVSFGVAAPKCILFS
jgi:6-phosphogluconolactonase